MYNHIHGGNFQSYLKKYSMEIDDIIDFSVNINPLGAPDIIKKNWRNLLYGIENYPSIEADDVVEFYSKKFGLNRESIIAGNGSIDLIYLSPKALNIKTAAIIEPSFYDYRRAFEINGCEISSIKLKEGNNFKLLLKDKDIKTIEKSDATILANPNNPTGKVIDRKIILELAQRFPNNWFLIDEAFIQFVENYDSISLMYSNLNNIVVFHSLTKFYALAGLRLGAAIGKRKAIDKFKAIASPWRVNSIAQKAARLLIHCKEYEQNTMELIRTEKIRIEQRLKDAENIKLFTTDANFFLAKWFGSNSLDDLLKYLFKKELFVRDCRNFKGLSGNFFRFAILKKAPNDKLMDAILNYD